MEVLRIYSFAVLTICHTCIMLSSDTEQITQGSFGFQEKSEILAVCPPWMNCQNKQKLIRLSKLALWDQAETKKIKFVQDQ